MVVTPLASTLADASQKPASRIAQRIFRLLPLAAAGLAGGIGVLGVLRHIAALSGLVATLPALQWMKFNTAMCLISLATAVAVLPRRGAQPWRALYIALAAFPIVLGLATIAQYLFSIDLQIDQLLIRDDVRGYPIPGRMGINTAVCLILLGSSQLLIERARLQWLAQLAALIAASQALFVVVGHAAGMDELHRVELIGLMSLPTAVAILGLSLGLLCIPTITGVLQKLDLPVRVVSIGLVALIALLAITAYIYFHLAMTALRGAEQAFALESTPVANAITAYVDRASQTLLGARGLFAALGDVSREQWRKYVAAQKGAPTPGIMGVGFSEWIEPGRLISHEQKVRAEGFPGYQVNPSGVREVYTSIVYLEPFEGQNLRAFGYDMYSDPVRREAMRRAIGTSRPTMSAPVQLLQNDAGDTQPGFLIYVPVYAWLGADEDSRQLLGFAYSPVRLADLVLAAVKYVHQARPRIGFDLADAAAPDAVLYRFPQGWPLTSAPMFESRTYLHVAQRDWVLHFYSLPQFELANRSLGAIAALYAGTLLSVALVTLAFLLVGYRNKARALAVRTDELGYQLALNRGVTEQMADPVFVIDLEGCVTVANAAAEEQFGYSREELQGRPLQGTIHHHRQDGSACPRGECPIARSLVEDALLNHEMVCWRKDGRAMNVLVSATPLYTSGRRTGAVVVTHDITTRKLAEESLLRSNQELQRFAYVASHDLQTPLRSIASFAQLLQQALGSRIDARETDWLQRIVNNIRKMQRLIESLLAYARVSVASTSLRTDLNETVNSVLDLLRPAIVEHGATVSVAPLPVVQGNPTQLAQVFQNLIGNALKYRSRRPLHIDVGAELRGSEYYFSVRDNGIGIRSEFHEQIFEPFKRLHTERTHAGTGVGLAICRRAVEQHGGRLWVESEPGVGSTFWFTLPAHPGEAS
jgi:PAS domain S-box-containing protein